MNTLTKAAMLMGLVALVGCRDGGDDGALEILPNISPIQMGQMFPPDGTEDPGTNERVPFEAVLLLKTESSALDIEKVCLEGSPDALLQFALEGPVPNEPKRDEDAALRITYERQAPGGPDNVAVVVQSNAENFPTLVVPVCAQVVADGGTRMTFACTSPVTVAPGTKDESLCAD